MEKIAKGDITPDVAKSEIKEAISSGTSASTIYSTLLRFVWLATTERRLDPELRRWHRTLLDVAHMVKQSSDPDAARMAVSIRSLSDLLRISIAMSDGPSTNKMLHRPNEAEVLNFIREKGDFVTATTISQELGIRRPAVLRILTNLISASFVQRHPRASEALFRA